MVLQLYCWTPQLCGRTLQRTHDDGMPLTRLLLANTNIRRPAVRPHPAARRSHCPRGALSQLPCSMDAVGCTHAQGFSRGVDFLSPLARGLERARLPLFGCTSCLIQLCGGFDPACARVFESWPTGVPPRTRLLGPPVGWLAAPRMPRHEWVARAPACAAPLKLLSRSIRRAVLIRRQTRAQICLGAAEAHLPAPWEACSTCAADAIRARPGVCMHACFSRPASRPCTRAGVASQPAAWVHTASSKVASATLLGLL